MIAYRCELHCLPTKEPILLFLLEVAGNPVGPRPSVSEGFWKLDMSWAVTNSQRWPMRKILQWAYTRDECIVAIFCCFMWYWLGFYRILQRLPLVSPHISQHLSTLWCCWDHMQSTLLAKSTSLFTWLSVTMSLVFQYFVGILQVMQTYPSLHTSGAFPFGRSTCVLSAFAHLALDWSFEEQATLPYPLALSRRLQRGLVGVFLIFCAVAFNWFLYPMLQRHLLSFRSWQKGDRPDNGDVEPCSIQPKKKCIVAKRSPKRWDRHWVYTRGETPMESVRGWWETSGERHHKNIGYGSAAVMQLALYSAVQLNNTSVAKIEEPKQPTVAVEICNDKEPYLGTTGQ